MKRFLKFSFKTLSLITAFALCFSITIPMNVLGVANTEKAHWADTTIKDWTAKGLAKGYPDGSFKPDNNITRAEFMALVNNAFNFTKESNVSFTDVESNSWYYSTVRKAVAAGYIEGYADATIKPNNNITRAEAATIIYKVEKLYSDPETVKSFLDAVEIADWSKGYIGAVVSAGHMKGYPNGSFNAPGQIKRAEAITALNNVIAGRVIYDKAGTYGPETGALNISGNVYIKADGVVLRNINIKGNLTIGEEVGDGDVTLNNVTVQGKTFIRGGGENSIHINGGEYNKIIVQETANGKTRIVAINADGVEIVISDDAAGEEIILEGDFESVVLEADNLNVRTQGDTTIGEIVIGKESQGTQLTLNIGTTVDEININSDADINGQGIIKEANITSGGVTFDKAPQDQNVADGTQAPTTNPPTNTGGSSGGTPVVQAGVPKTFDFEVRQGSFEFELSNIKDVNGNAINLSLLELDGNSLVEFIYIDQFDDEQVMSTLNFSFLGIDEDTLLKNIDFTNLYNYWMGQALIAGFDQVVGFDVTIRGTYNGDVFEEKIEDLNFTDKAAITGYIKTSLLAAITAQITTAEGLLTNTVVGTDLGEISQEAYDDLDGSVDAAILVRDDLGATIAQYCTALDDLQQKMETFNNAIVVPTISIAPFAPGLVVGGVDSNFVVNVTSTLIPENAPVTVTLREDTPTGNILATANGTILANGTASVTLVIEDTIEIGNYYVFATVGELSSDGVMMSVTPDETNSSVTPVTPLSPEINQSFSFVASVRDGANNPVSGLLKEDFEYPGMITHTGTGTLTIVSVTEDGVTGNYMIVASYSKIETIDISVGVLYALLGTIEDLVIQDVQPQ